MSTAATVAEPYPRLEAFEEGWAGSTTLIEVWLYTAPNRRKSLGLLRVPPSRTDQVINAISRALT